MANWRRWLTVAPSIEPNQTHFSAALQRHTDASHANEDSAYTHSVQIVMCTLLLLRRSALPLPLPEKTIGSFDPVHTDTDTDKTQAAFLCCSCCCPLYIVAANSVTHTRSISTSENSVGACGGCFHAKTIRRRSSLSDDRRVRKKVCVCLPVITFPSRSLVACK